MSTSYISAALRQLVAPRAGLRCEYCHILEADTTLGCHVGHIISEKHGGVTQLENLAYACAFCNWHKGSDVASLADDGTLTRLFNPRLDVWEEHLALIGALLLAHTAVAEATLRLLKLNLPERILKRDALA